jgi:tRNA (cmo5U34)-methyltransferase
MGVAAHLGIGLSEYDRRIRTFIPWYDEMLDTAAGVLATVDPRARLVVDLGVGSGLLASRVLEAARSARIVGIDVDAGMLDLARRRLGDRLEAVSGDFQTARLPRCDAVTASFALHHVRTRRRKALLYSRCFKALRPGGHLVSADCCLASNARLQARDRQAWHAHLARRYGRAAATKFLATWAKEDAYFRLADEITLMKVAGFAVDVPWRRQSFAVVVGTKPTRRRVRALAATR